MRGYFALHGDKVGADHSGRSHPSSPKAKPPRTGTSSPICSGICPGWTLPATRRSWRWAADRSATSPGWRPPCSSAAARSSTFRPPCWPRPTARSAARPRSTGLGRRISSGPSTSRRWSSPIPPSCETLDPRQLRAGYAEVVKYGLIDDPAFFDWCEANGAALLAGDHDLRRTAIEHCISAKLRFVIGGCRRPRGAARAAQSRPQLRPRDRNGERAWHRPPRRSGRGWLVPGVRLLGRARPLPEAKTRSASGRISPRLGCRPGWTKLGSRHAGPAFSTRSSATRKPDRKAFR